MFFEDTGVPKKNSRRWGYFHVYSHIPQLQEETELLNSEERPAELEEVSEKIHKRFHIKETPGSSLVKVGGVGMVTLGRWG